MVTNITSHIHQTTVRRGSYYQTTVRRGSCSSRFASDRTARERLGAATSLATTRRIPTFSHRRCSCARWCTARSCGYAAQHRLAALKVAGSSDATVELLDGYGPLNVAVGCSQPCYWAAQSAQAVGMVVVVEFSS